MTGQVYHAWVIEDFESQSRPLGMYPDRETAWAAARELWGWKVVDVTPLGGDRAVA